MPKCNLVGRERDAGKGYGRKWKVVVFFSIKKEKKFLVFLKVSFFTCATMEMPLFNASDFVSWGL